MPYPAKELDMKEQNVNTLVDSIARGMAAGVKASASEAPLLSAATPREKNVCMGIIIPTRP
jgi:hypothetical protein